MHTQLEFENDMGGFAPGHISSYWCVWLKMPKLDFPKMHGTKELDPQTHTHLESVSPVERLNKPWLSGQGTGLTITNLQVPLSPDSYIVDMYVFIYIACLSTLPPKHQTK